jgi:hypothetical protein
MAASDYVPIFFKNHLHLAGRPQMSTRPSRAIDLDQCDRIAIGFAYKGKKPTRKDRGVSS